MSHPIRCRRCGALFVPDCVAAVITPWRLCPSCRGPQLPTGAGAPIPGRETSVPCPPEAAP